MWILPFADGGVVRAASSSALSAFRASPSDWTARCSRASASALISCAPSPRSLSLRARCCSATRQCTSIGSSWNTCDRETSADVSTKYGLCVVAPIKRTAPFSTSGSRTSCCALLSRWISSMNTMVRISLARSRSAAELRARRMSATEFSTPLSGSKCALVERAMMRAREVFPVPGGPKSRMEVIRSASMARRSSLPGPRRWAWPVYSDRESGRMRSARGALAERAAFGPASFKFFSGVGVFKNRSAMRRGTMHQRRS